MRELIKAKKALLLKSVNELKEIEEMLRMDVLKINDDYMSKIKPSDYIGMELKCSSLFFVNSVLESDIIDDYTLDIITKYLNDLRTNIDRLGCISLFSYDDAIFIHDNAIFVGIDTLEDINDLSLKITKARINIDKFDVNKYISNLYENIYFMSDASGYIKIGRTKCTLSRLNQLRCGNPTLELLGSVKCFKSIKLENVLHKHFAEHKIVGEWFKVTEKQLNAFFEKKYSERMRIEFSQING